MTGRQRIARGDGHGRVRREPRRPGVASTRLARPNSGYNYKGWGRSYDAPPPIRSPWNRELARVIAEELRLMVDRRKASKM